MMHFVIVMQTEFNTNDASDNNFTHAEQLLSVNLRSKKLS